MDIQKYWNSKSHKVIEYFQSRKMYTIAEGIHVESMLI